MRKFLSLLSAVSFAAPAARAQAISRIGPANADFPLGLSAPLVRESGAFKPGLAPFEGAPALMPAGVLPVGTLEAQAAPERALYRLVAAERAVPAMADPSRSEGEAKAQAAAAFEGKAAQGGAVSGSAAEPVSQESLARVNGEVLGLRGRVWKGALKPDQFYPEVRNVFAAHYGADYGDKVRTFLYKEVAARPKDSGAVDFAKMGASDRKAFFHQMPKGAELHLHLTGAGDPQTWLAIAEKFDTEFPTPAIVDALKHMGADPAALGVDVSKPTIKMSRMSAQAKEIIGKSLVTNEHDRNLLDFLKKWLIIDPITSNLGAFYPLIEQVALTAKAQGVLYLELIESSDPAVLDRVARDAQRVEEKTGVVIRILAYNRWGQDNADLEKGMKAADALRAQGVVGFNMVANEFNRPLAHYEAFDLMRRTMPGVRASLHAGEPPGTADNIVNDMLLNAKRYGHATQVDENPIAMALLYANKTPVEVSLISNKLSGVMPDLAKHPLPRFLAWGIPAILSTDDPGVFGSSLSQEYETAQGAFGLSWGDLKTISRNGIIHSFADEATKARLLRELDARFMEFEGSELFKKHVRP